MKQESIWNHQFMVALLGYFFLFMSITLFFIFPLFFEQLHVSRSRIGMIMGIHSLMAIFTRPVFGRLIDLKGRRLISLLGIALLMLVTPGFHLIRDAGLFPLILRALTGIGWGISMTATVTICSDLAPVNRLARSMGIIGVAGLLSAALGPLLGEEIVRQFGFPWLFNASLIFLGISFLCMFLTREMRPLDNNLDKRLRIPESIVNMALFPVIIIVLMTVSHGAVRSSVVNFIALYVRSIPLERVGPFFVAFSGAAIATRLFFGDLSDRYGRKQVILPAAGLIALNLVLISQVQSSWMLVLTGILGGLGQGLIFPALSTYIIDSMGHENKGLAISLYLTFFDVGMAGGSVLFGWVSDLYGFRSMYIISGAAIAVVVLLFSWKAPSSDRRET
ncbi:MAG: MFS transporter [Candidatus Aminicenantaceae bacterium]